MKQSQDNPAGDVQDLNRRLRARAMKARQDIPVGEFSDLERRLLLLQSRLEIWRFADAVAEAIRRQENISLEQMNAVAALVGLRLGVSLNAAQPMDALF